MTLVEALTIALLGLFAGVVVAFRMYYGDWRRRHRLYCAANRELHELRELRLRIRVRERLLVDVPLTELRLMQDFVGHDRPAAQFFLAADAKDTLCVTVGSER